MEELRFAVIGTSMISDNFIEALGCTTEGAYLGSMSRSPETAAEKTAQWGGTRPFTSVGDLAACDEVDAVYIASPNAIHFEQALDLIRAGKHVLVEKPLASDARRARRLFEEARQHGVVAMEAMRPVHDPGLALIKEAMERIGTPRRASLRFGKYSSRYDDVLAGRQTNIFDARLATGALMDLGIYCVESMVALFGAPERVSCLSVDVSSGREDLTGGRIDGAGTILAGYGDAIVELSYSKITSDMLGCQIEGELGTIAFDDISAPSRGSLLIRGRAQRNAAKAALRSTGDVIEDLAFSPCSNSMVYEAEDFIACIRGELDPVRYEEITVTSLDIMDEARRQAGIVFPMD